MADKDTRVERERLGRPVDELVTGRAPNSGDRPGDYTASEIAGQTSGATPAAATRRRTAEPASREAGDDGKEAKPDGRSRDLRAEIERTREDMSETVNAIQDRLRPGNIASNAAESIRDVASERTRDLVESEPVQYARANPIPTAMIGIGVAGLAWLAFGGRGAHDLDAARPYGRRNRGYYYPGYDDEAEDYRRARGVRGSYERYDDGAPDTSGRESGEGMAGRVAGDVRERASDVTRGARRQAARAQSSLQRTWNDSPLLIGAASAVLGALVGMAVPETHVENEWMGEHRDDMIEGVQQAVREKVDDVQHAATDAANQVKDVVGIKEEG